jgi:hypothetical protein
MNLNDQLLKVVRVHDPARATTRFELRVWLTGDTFLDASMTIDDVQIAFVGDEDLKHIVAHSLASNVASWVKDQILASFDFDPADRKCIAERVGS